MIKALIFDMNGVIVDDEPLHERAFKVVCRDYGHDLSRDTYKKLCLGKTDRDGFLNIIKEFNLNGIKVNELVSAKSKEYDILSKTGLMPVAGVVEFIKKHSRNYLLAVVSGASSKEIENTLEIFKVKDLFKVVVGAEDITKSKPDPESYLKAARLLNIEPEECIVFEDSVSGVQAAKLAGMKCVAITTSCTKGDLRLADAFAGSFLNIDKGLKSIIDA